MGVMYYRRKDGTIEPIGAAAVKGDKGDPGQDGRDGQDGAKGDDKVHVVATLPGDPIAAGFANGDLLVLAP